MISLVMFTAECIRAVVIGQAHAEAIVLESRSDRGSRHGPAQQQVVGDAEYGVHTGQVVRIGAGNRASHAADESGGVLIGNFVVGQAVTVLTSVFRRDRVR